MMRCTNIFGHKWGDWILSYSGEKKGQDDRIYRPLVQRRDCSKCNFRQTEWINEIQFIEPADTAKK